jgi:hypothetical protein
MWQDKCAMDKFYIGGVEGMMIRRTGKGTRLDMNKAM